MLYLTSKETNKDALENLMKVLENTSERRLLSHKLFGSRDEVHDLLDEERNAFQYYLD